MTGENQKPIAQKKNDPFDEFEFKPLTDGLGFHRKAVNLRDDIAESGLSRTGVTTDIPSIPNAMVDDGIGGRATDENNADAGQISAAPIQFSQESKSFDGGRGDSSQRTQLFKQPLPRDEDIQDEKREGAAAKKKENYSALQNVDTKLDLDFDKSTAQEKALDKSILHEEMPEPQIRKIPVHLTSGFFDLVVVFTLAIIFLASMMMVTKIDMVSILANAEATLLSYASLAVLYLAVLQLYLVIGRSFAGCTLGEWAFDVRLANRSGGQSSWFALKVIWRCMVNLVTGVIVLPMLSFIIRRDIAGFLSGTQLTQQQ